MTLPYMFLERMKRILGDEFDLFAAQYEKPYRRGVRVNTLKFPLERSAELGVCAEKVPFSPLGFYSGEPAESFGHMPFHHAGAFYSQEPSAMVSVTALDPQKGERILDMCAAPGGKATQAAALLGGSGLLYANEIVRQRAGILLSNIERMGITNAVVTSLHPDRYAENMPGYFDRVLVDAPCSGEGMFRRDPRAVSEWSPEHVASCAVRQAAILDSAARCVRPGGVLVYSTCTFSPEENEHTVASFLARHDEFSLEPIPVNAGRKGLDCSDRFDLTLTRRIYPMDGGEGHFAARLRKEGEPENDIPELPDSASALSGTEKAPDCAVETLGACLTDAPGDTLRRAGDNVYILPRGYAPVPGIPVIRAGVLAAELKKNRAEPAHALFMSRQAAQCRQTVNLESGSAELAHFLHGEEISCPEEYSGYAAVLCSGIVTGFGKASGGRLKNRYPKGLREP